MLLKRIWNRGLHGKKIQPRRLQVELLEGRELPSAVPLSRPEGAAVNTVYVESNNPASGQNAVLAFHSDPATGELAQFGQFKTGGTGLFNVPKAVGPDDGDHQIVTSPDGRFLYAVNEGSHSITAFAIRPDGGLDRIGTVDSGGVQPDGLTLVGDKLYVANRGDASSAKAGTVAPNITGFYVSGDGSLSPIPDSTVEFAVGDYVTQVLANKSGRLLFAQVASLSGAADGNTIAPFQIQGDGSLKASPGGPQGASSNPSLQLGAAFNPNLNIIYAGLTLSGEVGVYTYDETGRTSFVGASSDQGAAPCWCTVSADGDFLYVANTVSNSIEVYSLADPLHPIEIQDFALGGPQGGSGSNRQTADFEIALDPSGHTLYVVNQNTSASAAFPQGNQLHSLKVGRDGTVSEPTGPLVFNTGSVPADAHPQGIAVVSANQLRHHKWSHSNWQDEDEFSFSRSINLD